MYGISRLVIATVGIVAMFVIVLIYGAVENDRLDRFAANFQGRDVEAGADLYFQAVAYSGVNWEIAGGYWRDLCAAAPFFKNSCERLNAALEGHGDQLAYLLDWCPAVSVYQEAWNRQPSERVEGKLNQARDGCAAATPVPITGNVTLPGTAHLTDTSSLETGD